MSKIFCLVLLSAAIAAEAAVKCGVNHISNDRIVGGVDAKPHEFPWVVFLQMHLTSHTKPNLIGLCDGSLINDQWIVTASHCFHPIDGYEMSKIDIVFGAHNLSKTPETGRLVESFVKFDVFRHPEFKDADMIGSRHDVALIKLNKKIDLEAHSKYIVPVCLPEANDQSHTDCTVIGWGKTGEFEETSKTLKKVSVNLINAEECHEKYQYDVNDLQVCAGSKNHGTCNGDSGGPLMCKNSEGAYVLKGIVSYGEKHCAYLRPGVFTNVNKFVDWIEKTQKQHP